ncbi:nuclear transport factor 2 family protein [Daejeonella lutea]|uniref:Putative lumazine-binding n=1 Tax=Daejeonella lutea TaxID=572036 RepID=A0A1T5F7F1_9SPHI|nr:nuclear transport factor 2 family protein [Daejeonella lutea]SKB92041.1 Putative lumazine-binding [Daejeonella lutea]
MKLKSFLLCTVLGAVLTTATFANTPPSAEAKNVLDAYAESHVNTDASKLEKILSYDALMKFSKGSEVMSQGQAAIIKLMRQNQGIKQNCSTVVDVLASSDAMVLAKVNFVYEGFVIENYLTLELDRNQNWKITRINKFYTEAGSPKVLTQE